VKKRLKGKINTGAFTENGGFQKAAEKKRESDFGAIKCYPGATEGAPGRMIVGAWRPTRKKGSSKESVFSEGGFQKRFKTDRAKGGKKVKRGFL